MNIQGNIYENEDARHVIGHLPGVKGDPRAQMDNRLIIVLAQYDSPPLTTGEPIPGAANDNSHTAGVRLSTE